MEVLNDILPIVLYFLGAVLLIVVIILVSKLITTVDKVNVLLDDVEDKSQKLNGLFDAIEKVGDTLSVANNKLTGAIAGVFSKLFKAKKKTKKTKEIIEEEEDE